MTTQNCVKLTQQNLQCTTYLIVWSSADTEEDRITNILSKDNSTTESGRGGESDSVGGTEQEYTGEDKKAFVARQIYFSLH